MIKLAAAVLAAVAALAGPACAQDIRTLAPGAAPAPATLADMKNLLGDWAGPMAAAGFSMTPDGQIVGHLEVSNGATPRVEEIWIFRPEGGSVLVRQKHFGPDLVPREDKDTWSQRRLVAFDPGHIYLENLTWVTQGDTLTLSVRLPGPNGGPPVVSTNVLKRVK